MPDGARSGERTFRGIPVSPGICRGKIFVLGRPHGDHVPRLDIPEAAVPDEIKRLQQALLDTRHQIIEVQRQVTDFRNSCASEQAAGQTSEAALLGVNR